MRILSIDCATKSLAVSLVDFNSNWETDLSEISERHTELWKSADTVLEKQTVLINRLTEVEQLLDTLITLRYVNVFDLLPGEPLKGASIEKRMGRLKGVIQYIKKVNSSIEGSDIDKVLVEYQMSANDKSRNVSTALIYEFGGADHEFTFSGTSGNVEKASVTQIEQRVVMVGPSLKSKVYFGSSGKIQNFRRKYMNNYDANKAHAKYNFTKWLENHDSQNKIAGIAKKNLDDVADSFLMAYGWCIKNYVR